MELVCDLFATYLTGPAFGWQMQRAVCLLGIEELYAVRLGGSHPSVRRADRAAAPRCCAVLGSRPKLKDHSTTNGTNLATMLGQSPERAVPDGLPRCPDRCLGRRSPRGLRVPRSSSFHAPTGWRVLAMSPRSCTRLGLSCVVHLRATQTGSATRWLRYATDWAM